PPPETALPTVSSTSARLPHDSAKSPSVCLVVSHSSRLVSLLRREVSGQAEEREQRLGVEERVPARDAVARQLEDDERPRLVSPVRTAWTVMSEGRRTAGRGWHQP